MPVKQVGWRAEADRHSNQDHLTNKLYWKTTQIPPQVRLSSASEHQVSEKFHMLDMACLDK